MNLPHESFDEFAQSKSVLGVFKDADRGCNPVSSEYKQD